MFDLLALVASAVDTERFLDGAEHFHGGEHSMCKAEGISDEECTEQIESYWRGDFALEFVFVYAYGGVSTDLVDANVL